MKWRRVEEVLWRDEVESDDDCVYYYREVYGEEEAVEACFGVEHGENYEEREEKSCEREH